MTSAAAILFGLALGDTLGYEVEFKSLSQIKQDYGPAGIVDLPDPPEYSDDTQMSIALAEGLLEAGFDAPLDAQMDTVGRHFLKWAHSPENNRAPGITCMSGLQNYESGTPWRESGNAGSKGCGAAMRVGLLGWIYQHDEARLRELAVASSVITHRHPTAAAAAAAAAFLVKLALDRVPPGQYLARTMAFLDGMDETMEQALRAVAHVGAWTNEEEALEHIGRGWVGEEAVALAVYCVLRYPDDYTACMRRAANTEGDSDSIACIAGSISGARLGLEAIPADWRARCEHAADLARLAARLETARSAFLRS
jgi:ADP-ribosylglycohydrolase